MIQDCSSRNKKVFIWGTGNNAKLFIKRYAEFRNSSFERYKHDWEESIAGFIDSDSNKWGTFFENKPVVSPDKAFEEGMTLCIITVDNNIGIIDALIKEGYKEGQFLTWKDFIVACRQYALDNCNDIPDGYGFEECKHDAESGSNDLQRHIYLARYFDGVKEKKEVKAFLSEFEPFAIVDAMNWYFGDDISGACKWCEKWLDNKNREQRIKTIGIMIDRYYGGGIERATSYLIDSYTRAGYKVVLITEECNKEKEYPLGDDVIRCNLDNKHDESDIKRFRELQDSIAGNRIDLVCFHTGYARLSTFYEIILTKILGVYSILELRSAFIALIVDQKRFSDKYSIMFRVADRVLTLSETDRFFWNCLGCKSVFIPNPVGALIKNKPTPRINKKKALILWVGRIVQTPKQVLDVVDIAECVVNQYKEVSFRIIGGRDNDKIYRMLKQKITDKNLESYVEICEYRPDINNDYEESDVVLMTSASESYSNVIVEAKSHSRPIVMYELPWLNTVKENKGIISIPQRDRLSAGQAIISLLTNQGKWERLSNEAWESACALAEYDYMTDWKTLFSDIETNRAYNSDIQDYERHTVKLLLDQFYGRGYPYLEG